MRTIRSTPKWLRVCIAVLATVLIYWAALITVGESILDIKRYLFQHRSPVELNVGSRHLLSSSNNTPSIPILSPYMVEELPTKTPSPIPPLDVHLEKALSITAYSPQGKALAIVATNAIIIDDYWTAIRAASLTPILSDQSTNLELVVKCAIEEGKFDIALEAASSVYLHSSQSRLTVMALEAATLNAKTATHSNTIIDDQLKQRGELKCLKDVQLEN